MLEKHLGHMKKSHAGAEAMAPPGLTKASMKSEESPVTSPATVTNWASPGGVIGASPVPSASDEFGNPIAGSPAYVMPPGMNPGPSPQAMTFATSPTGPNMRQQVQQAQAQQAHKRQISEISGGQELSADMRRPPIFMPVPGGPAPPPHMIGQPPMNIHMQAPGPMPPRR